MGTPRHFHWHYSPARAAREAAHTARIRRRYQLVWAALIASYVAVMAGLAWAVMS